MLELNQLYNMNCMHGMREFPDGFFDLAIVDPPYGLVDAGAKKGGEKGDLENRAFKRSKIAAWDHAPAPEYFDELFRVSKNQIIWGANYFRLPPCRCFIVWDKKQPFENFSRCEYAWTSFKSPAKIFEFDNRYSGKIHPTQKPVQLYKWLLYNYSKPGQIILDTHGGSCSSLIACYDMKNPFIGFELDAGYFAAAQKRLQEHFAQLTFF